MDSWSRLIVGGKDERRVDRNTVEDSRLGDGWTLNPTSAIYKGEKNFTPSFF